jgi:hypothetical protein
MVQFFRCNSFYNVIYNEESEPVIHWVTLGQSHWYVNQITQDNNCNLI